MLIEILPSYKWDISGRYIGGREKPMVVGFLNGRLVKGKMRVKLGCEKTKKRVKKRRKNTPSNHKRTIWWW